MSAAIGFRMDLSKAHRFHPGYRLIISDKTMKCHLIKLWQPCSLSCLSCGAEAILDQPSIMQTPQISHWAETYRLT